MVEHKMVPSIRFKGFYNDWEQRELADILERRQVYQQISKSTPRLAFAAGQGVIPLTERKTNNRDQLIADEATKRYLLTEYNDLVYNPANLKYGAIDRNKYGTGVISPIYVTFTTTEEPSFIERIITSDTFKLKALQFEEGTVIKRQSVSPDSFLSLKVWISPYRKEQCQIGTFFSQLDNIINFYQRKHDKMLNVKKALLEKMFPKEGERVPELRFKEFASDWEQYKLSDIAVISKGEQINRAHLSNYGKYYVLNGGMTPSGYTDTFNAKANTISISEGGNSCGFVAYNTTNFWSGGHNYTLQEPKINVKYLYQYLKYQEENIMALRVGSGLPNIQKSRLSNVLILVPDVNEQKLISKFLFGVDNLIVLLQYEVEKLNNIKKAMLGKMFV